MLPNQQVLIQDELSGLKPDDLVRWALGVTEADIHKVSRNESLAPSCVKI